MAFFANRYAPKAKVARSNRAGSANKSMGYGVSSNTSAWRLTKYSPKVGKLWRVISYAVELGEGVGDVFTDATGFNART